MDQRRLFFAIGLSLAFLFLWQTLFPQPMPKKRAQVPDAVTADSKVLSPSDTLTLQTLRPTIASHSETVALESSALTAALPLEPARSVTLDLATMSATIDETGGILSSLTLDDFFTLSPPPRGTHNVSLVTHIPEASGHMAILLDQDDRSKLGLQRWTVQTPSDSATRLSRTEPRKAGSDDVAGATTTILSSIPSAPELPSGIRFEKRLTFTGEYGATLDLSVANLSGQPRALSTGRLKYDLQNQTREGSLIVHFGPDLGNNAPVSAYIDQYMVTGSHELAGKHEIAVVDPSWTHGIFGAPIIPEGVKWAALENRYFVVAVMPSSFTVDALFSRDAKNRIHLYLLLPSFNLDPGESKTFSFRIFSGPKSTHRLHAFDPGFKQLDGMEPTILPKSMEIARWMVSFLGFIQSHVGNWGWSIVILTIIVRLLLYPLSYYQFKSMARMQALQPRIQELQAKFASDKERLQRELMKVYSEAGVNPIGGCLPILLQMPILIGLFLAFQSAIELRGVPFILWIKDLSIQDTLFTIPFIGIPINPLPILMCGTMMFQQKITPMTTVDPAQRQMMMMMPFIVTVFCYSFPSGLALYWVVQNILSIAQQYYMMKLKKEVPKNAGT